MPPTEVRRMSSRDGLLSSPRAQHKWRYDLIPFSILLRRHSREKFLFYFNHCSYPLSLQLGSCRLSKPSNPRQQFPEQLALVANILLVFPGSSQKRHSKHSPRNFGGTRYKIGPQPADTRLKAACGHRAPSLLAMGHQCCYYIGCLGLAGSNSYTTLALGGIGSVKAESILSWSTPKCALPSPGSLVRAILPSFSSTRDGFVDCFVQRRNM